MSIFYKQMFYNFHAIRSSGKEMVVLHFWRCLFCVRKTMLFQLYHINPIRAKMTMTTA